MGTKNEICKITTYVPKMYLDFQLIGKVAR